MSDFRGLRFAVRGHGAQITGLSLWRRRLSLEIVFHIFNPNEFPVNLRRAKYRVYVREGDVEIAEGSIDEATFIPSHTAEYVTSQVKSPITRDLSKMLKHQMEHGRTTLDFKGVAHIVTPKGPISTTFKAVWKLG